MVEEAKRRLRMEISERLPPPSKVIDRAAGNTPSMSLLFSAHDSPSRRMRSDFVTKLFATPTVRRHLAFAARADRASALPARRPATTARGRTYHHHAARAAAAGAGYRPPPPNEHAVLDPGHWNWDGRQYAWVAGHSSSGPMLRCVGSPATGYSKAVAGSGSRVAGTRI